MLSILISPLKKNFQLSFIRTLMKTHKGTAKRWKKITSKGIATQFIRHKAGRQHGNIGWSNRYLKHLSKDVDATPSQLKKLKKLMPY